MRDLRQDRARRMDVREERLRATAGLKAGPALSSWRGRSGRRYIVGVQSLAETDILDVADAVILAVRRDGDGTAHVVDIVTAGPKRNETARSRWLTGVQGLGATEIHIHRLADGETERRAIVDDLRADEPQTC
jgi:hypothetical protein